MRDLIVDGLTQPGQQAMGLFNSDYDNFNFLLTIRSKDE